MDPGISDSLPNFRPVHTLQTPCAREWLNHWRRRDRRSRTTAEPHTAPEVRSAKAARVEAALFVADAALSARKLAQYATLTGAREATELVQELNAAYERDGSAFRIERVASGYRLLTLPRFAPWLDRLHHRQTQLKLSSPMLETLSIVAYRQPVTRADIEAVRGVQSAEMLKQLMEKGLVKIVGEDDSLGRPYLYGTTRLFLERYGLTRLDDLPNAQSLRRVNRPVPEPDAESVAESDADSPGDDSAVEAA